MNKPALTSDVDSINNECLFDENYPFWLDYQSNVSDGFRDIDIAFAKFLYKYDTDYELLLLAALASYQLSFGNPCLNINDLFKSPLRYLPNKWHTELDTKYFKFLFKNKSHILKKLETSKYIGKGTGFEPLVLQQDNLYLRRFWQSANNIHNKTLDLIKIDYDFLNKNSDLLTELLNKVFNDNLSRQAGFTNWQKIACAAALIRRFCIITGGPGTGKTTTVVRLLCIFQALAINSGLTSGLRIKMAAPTGKAAARLNESINLALSSLDFQHDLLSSALSLIPTTVTTIHSLLGAKQYSRMFVHNANNLLDLDLLVVDEASMMDIEIFDAVLNALPSHARLIILGDKDQLASVEAGAIMGEFCARSVSAHYTPDYGELIYKLTGQLVADSLLDENGTDLDKAVVMLRKSYRFHENSGIGKLARAINQSNLNDLYKLINKPSEDLKFIIAKDQKWINTLFKPGGYPDLFNHINQLMPDRSAEQTKWDEYAKQILIDQTNLQILCAIRHGEWGTNNINKLVEDKLKKLSYVQTGNTWYLGRPVMILKNRSDIGLANGDIGITLLVPDPLDISKNIFRVAFTNSTNQIIWLSPARLDQVETVYALTVHKSQGSEFDHAIMVLPDRFYPVLTKELLYTGITRAKNKLSIVLPNDYSLLEKAVKNPTKRSQALLIDL